VPMIKSFSSHSKPTTLNHTKGTCVLGFYFFVVVVVIYYRTRAQSPPSLLCLLARDLLYFNVHKQIPSAVFSFVLFFQHFCVLFLSVSLLFCHLYFFLRREKLGDLQFPSQIGIPLFLNREEGAGTKGKRNLLNSHFTPGGGNCTAVGIEMDLFTFFSFLFLKSVLFIVVIVLGPLSSFHRSNFKDKLCRCPLSSSSSSSSSYLSLVNIHHVMNVECFEKRKSIAIDK